MTHTTKHTPGPWHTDGWENIVVNDQWGTTILCCAGSSTGTLPEIKANAALIAAAPAMYEALQQLVKVEQLRTQATLDNDYVDLVLADQQLQTLAQAALAQAEGRDK